MYRQPDLSDDGPYATPEDQDIVDQCTIPGYSIQQLRQERYQDDIDACYKSWMDKC